jgi:8-oxo-dGTP pyrophosphatase MutT (NUDIX family)
MIETAYDNRSGRLFWGDRGAGLFVLCPATGRVLLPLRSSAVNEPRTYGVWGGKIDHPGEDPESAAVREFREEAGYDGSLRTIKAHVFRMDGFEYHNFLALVGEEFKPRLGWETDRADWVTIPEMLARRSHWHFGLVDLWRHSGAAIRRHAAVKGRVIEVGSEITFLDTLEARRQGPKAVTEASLGRVYQHFLRSGKASWGILSPERGELTGRENTARLRDLQKEVRGLGLGYVRLRGRWKECTDGSIPYEKCPDDLKVDRFEWSLFVPGIDSRTIERLGRKFHQDTWIFAGPETDGKVHLISRVGGGVADIGTFHPRKIADSYSAIKGRPSQSFQFECVAESYGESLQERAFRVMHGAQS